MIFSDRAQQLNRAGAASIPPPAASIPPPPPPSAGARSPRLNAALEAWAAAYWCNSADLPRCDRELYEAWARR